MFDQPSTTIETKWISVLMSNDFHKIKNLVGKFNMKVVSTSTDIAVKRRQGSEKDLLKKRKKAAHI